MLDYSVDSYVGETSAAEVEKLKKYVKEFKTRYRGVNLYMYGPNSTQKTTLAKWLGVELLRRDGASVHYVLMDQLVKELTQEGFDEDVDPNLKIYRTVDVLIIDEAFDKAKVQWFKSGYQMSYLDRFLRQRMEQDENLSTILISNNDVESIRDNFNNSLYELIDRNTAGSKLQFQDHYAQANNFNPEDLWT
jgi:DNA replication protein DnaC